MKWKFSASVKRVLSINEYKTGKFGEMGNISHSPLCHAEGDRPPL